MILSIKFPQENRWNSSADNILVGTRIILNHMDDSQAPPPGTKGTVAYVDDIGQIGVKWDTGSSLSLIPGVDSFSKEPAPEKAKHKRSSSLER